MFDGIKTKISSIKNNEIFLPLEKIEIKEKGIIVETFETEGNIDPNLKSKLEVHMKKGLIGDDIWINPCPPFVIAIAGGFITSIILGGPLLYDWSFKLL